MVVHLQCVTKSSKIKTGYISDRGRLCRRGCFHRCLLDDVRFDGNPDHVTLRLVYGQNSKLVGCRPNHTPVSVTILRDCGYAAMNLISGIGVD